MRKGIWIVCSVCIVLGAFGIQNWWQQSSRQAALNQQLREALRIGADVEARQLIREGADVNTFYRYDDDVLDGLTALDVAVGAEDAAFVRELLTRGAHVEGNEGNHPLTPLVSASVAGNLEIVKILIEVGAKIDYGPGNFTWPLLEAARGGHTDTCCNMGRRCITRILGAKLHLLSPGNTVITRS